MSALEKDLERRHAKLAAERGWLVRKVQWPGRTGAPDRMYIKDGVVVFLEWKRSGQRLRPVQEVEIEALWNAGVYAYRVDSVSDADLALAHAVKTAHDKAEAEAA